MSGEKAFAIIVAFSVAFGFIGYRFGIYEASERFYEKCQGGSVTIESSGKLELVGCAEIARHIR